MALHIYPCLVERDTGRHIGGAEIQQASLGREFLKRDISVSFIIENDGVDSATTVEGFELYPAYNPQAGVRGFRFFYPRVPAIWRALKRSNADVYVVRGTSYLVGVVSLFTRLYGRAILFSAASDANFDPHLLRKFNRRDLFLYKLGLRRADAIVVQTRAQQEKLQDLFGRNGTVISNIVPRPYGMSCSERLPAKRDIVLWVANLNKLKRAEHFLEVARELREETFVMIGGVVSSQPATFEEIEKDAKEIDNLFFLGPKAFGETSEYFRRAKVFVNTSLYEGFPNTFLQAWSNGVPVVSYVDPDGTIAEHGLGEVVTNLEELKEAVRAYRKWDDDLARRISVYCNDHFLTDSVDLYISLIDQLAAKSTRRIVAKSPDSQ